MNNPNLLFILTDQMRATAMGCAGLENVITPNLDALARQGTRFTRAIANSPACSPSRASLWSGMHAINHQLVNNDIPLRTDFHSFAHALNDRGYRCGYVGKWHLDCNDRGIRIPPGPRRQGFDDFWAAFNCNHDYFEGYYYRDDEPHPVWIDGYEPEGQTDLAIDYLSRKSGQPDPFCLVLSWGPPHDPYRDVPQKYLDLYPQEELRLKPNAPADADRSDLAGYYAHITALDRCLARLLRALDEKGLSENTLVVFTSDHGDMIHSQGEMYKSKPWIESVNIPLIMRWPGKIPAGRVSGAPIGIVDFMPTLLSLCGAEIPSQAEGVDLSRFVLGDETAGQESVFINQPVVPAFFTHPAWRGVVTRTHTYARTRERPWLLHDDLTDPHQLHNLAESPKHTALRESMEELLQGWLQRIGDPFESSEDVAAKFYPGSVDGVMPYTENEVVAEGKRLRRERRLKS